MKKFPKKGEAGFSFIEILVFTTIVSFLFITLTTVVTSSLRKMQTVEYRLYATRYAEELMEWLRAEKDGDWNTFAGRDPTATGTVYCFNDELSFDNPASNWATATGACADYNGIVGTSPSIFKRYVVLTQNGTSPATQVNVQVIVEWPDGNQYLSVPLNNVFTSYTD